MPVRLVDRVRCFAQEVELAELVRRSGQRCRHGAADLCLAVADHTLDRHPGAVRHFAQQRGEVARGAGQQAARQQHLAGQAVADDPEYLMADIGCMPSSPR